MKTLNFSFVLTNIVGDALKNPQQLPLIAGYSLGQNLVAGSEATPSECLKFYDWAVAMAAGKPIVVDKADYKKIYDFIEKSQALTILAKAQIFRYMDSVKEEEA